MAMLNVLQFDNENLKRRLLFTYRRGKGRFLKYFLNRFQWNYFAKYHILSSKPPHIDIEPTSICNMSCPMCFTNFTDVNRNGFMDLSLYKKIIDDAAELGIFSVRLSHRGEPLLHKNYLEMVSYAKKKGIPEVSTLTNGLLLDKEMIQGLFDAGLDWLNISIDGVGSAYESIRRPAKFADIEEKVKFAHALRTQRKMVRPIIWVQSIWSAVEKNPAEYINKFSPYVDKIAFHVDNDYANKFEKEPSWVCHRLWHRMMILWDGRVPLCNSDFECKNQIGDMRRQTIKEVWLGEEMQKARELNLKKQRLKLIPCDDICNWGNKRVWKTVVIDGKEQRILSQVLKDK
ncbi:MAG: radical SAM/SPASM domain-containing protein [Candidatus Omnitrophota bacterium]|jgi:hypothetical protein